MKLSTVAAPSHEKQEETHPRCPTTKMKPFTTKDRTSTSDAATKKVNTSPFPPTAAKQNSHNQTTQSPSNPRIQPNQKEDITQSLKPSAFQLTMSVKEMMDISLPN